MRRLFRILSPLFLTVAFPVTAGDFSEFLDRTGSLSIATESAGEPNRVEGRIFAPIAPNDTDTANYLLDLSAYIKCGFQ